MKGLANTTLCLNYVRVVRIAIIYICPQMRLAQKVLIILIPCSLKSRVSSIRQRIEVVMELVVLTCAVIAWGLIALWNGCRLDKGE